MVAAALAALAALAAAVVVAAPATAIASPPWSAPAVVPDGAAPAAAAFAATGQGLLLTSRGLAPGNRAGAPTQLVGVSPEGTVTATTPLAYAGDALATYGSSRLAIAGRTVARSGPYAGTITGASSIVTQFGTPAGLGPARAIAGSKGQQLYGLAANARGLMAVATGTARSRSVYLRRPGSATFTRKLRIAVTSRARGATVAVGQAGDVLFVYEDAHEIRARHIGPRGTIGAVHRLGAGVQSDLQAIVNDDGRLAVAWKSQRVNEGESATPALIWFATAAPRHGFGTARRIATVGATGGAGRYLAAPGVRLLAIGDDALLANTGFDGAHYTVEARQVTGGHLGRAERLSPPGVDAVLGDAAATARGAQIVAWRAGILGADPIPVTAGNQPPATPVLASVRAAGAAAFGGPELVSGAFDSVPTAPLTALDPVSGRAIVAFAPPGATVVAARPAF